MGRLDRQPREICLLVAESIDDACDLASFSAASRSMRYTCRSTLFGRFFKKRGPAWVTRRLLAGQDPLLVPPPEADVATALTLLGELGRGLWEAPDLLRLHKHTDWRPGLYPYTTWTIATAAPSETCIDIGIIDMAAAWGLDDLVRCLAGNGVDVAGTHQYHLPNRYHDDEHGVDLPCPLVLAISHERVTTAALLLELGAPAGNAWQTALRLGRADFAALLMARDPGLTSRRCTSPRCFGEQFQLVCCLEYCVRDPVDIFRQVGDDLVGLETGDRFPNENFLHLAIRFRRHKTARWLARHPGSAIDVVPVLAAGLPYGNWQRNKRVRALAEVCIRDMAPIHGETISEWEKQESRPLVSEMPGIEDDWRWLDEMHRVLGLASPLILARPERPCGIDADTALPVVLHYSDTHRGCANTHHHELYRDIDYVLRHPTTPPFFSERLDPCQTHIFRTDADVPVSGRPWPQRMPGGLLIESTWCRADYLTTVDGSDEQWRHLVHRPLLEWASAASLEGESRASPAIRLCKSHNARIIPAYIPYARDEVPMPPPRRVESQSPASMDFCFVMDADRVANGDSRPRTRCRQNARIARIARTLNHIVDSDTDLCDSPIVLSILAAGPSGKVTDCEREMGLWHHAQSKRLLESGIVEDRPAGFPANYTDEVDFVWGLIVRGHHWSLVMTEIRRKGVRVLGGAQRCWTRPIGSTETLDGITRIATLLPLVLAWLSRLYVRPIAERLIVAAQN